MPPITSTTRSTSSRLTRASASVVSRCAGTSGWCAGRRTAMPATSTGAADAGGEVVGLLVDQPQHRAADGAAAQQRDLERSSHEVTPTGCSGRAATVRAIGRRPASTASRANTSASVCRRTISVAGAVADGDHRRLEQVVVVAGHRPAVGAGGGDGEQVAGLHVGGQPQVADQDVAALAVLADDAAERGRGVGGRGWPARRCSWRRRGRCGCCRSSRRRPRRSCAPAACRARRSRRAAPA